MDLNRKCYSQFLSPKITNHPSLFFFLTLFIPSFFLKIFLFPSLILLLLLFLHAINAYCLQSICIVIYPFYFNNLDNNLHAINAYCLQSICIVIYPFYFNNFDSNLIFNLYLMRYSGITHYCLITRSDAPSTC